MRVGIVLTILSAAIGTNVVVNLRFPVYADRFPFIGVAVWAIILLSTPIRQPDWHLLTDASRGAAFLLSLVIAASMMPVQHLPAASWHTAFGMGFVSAVFDNIPLTKLALDQGGYDWGVLAYAVGFGGSMIWFGSSSGVALANLFPQARSVGGWIRHGWHVSVAYVVGFFVMLGLLGWHPQPSRRAAPTQGSSRNQHGTPMILRDTTEIRSTPEAVFQLFNWRWNCITYDGTPIVRSAFSSSNPPGPHEPVDLSALLSVNSQWCTETQSLCHETRRPTTSNSSYPFLADQKEQD